MREDKMDDLDPKHPCDICGDPTRKYGSINHTLGGDREVVAHYVMPEESRYAGKAYTYNFRLLREKAIASGALPLDGKGFCAAFICDECFDDLIDAGLATPKPDEVCEICKTGYNNVWGHDVTEVEANGEAYMGYGSTTADGDVRKFDLSPGKYCYKCLDQLVKDGKSKFVKAYMFLNDLRDDQPRDSIETYKQAMLSARNDIGVFLRMMEGMRKVTRKRGVKFTFSGHKEPFFRKLLRHLAFWRRDELTDHVISVLMFRRRFEATTEVITEVLGDAEYWKDGESAH